MKKLFSFIVLFLLTVFLSTNSITAQGKLGVVGKKYSRTEANVLFGNVITSVKVSREELKAALANVKDYLLFKIRGNQALLLNERKAVLNSSSTAALSPNEVAYAFSKSVVEDFLAFSTANTFEVEQRNDVLSVSDNFTTLELSTPCPPMCPF